MIRNKSGKVAITLALTGIAALAAICFGLYVWTNMPESGIENPEIGTPLLYVGILIVIVIIIIMLIKAAR